MRIMFRLLAISVLIFSSELCFAGSVEEANRLKALLDQMDATINFKASSTARKSSKSIDMQKLQGAPFLDRVEAVEAVCHSKTDPLGVSSPFPEDLLERDLIKAFNGFEEKPDDPRHAVILRLFEDSWGPSLLNSCGEFAFFTLYTVVFDVMAKKSLILHNPSLDGKGAFFEAITLVGTVKNGDHIFTLVEGKSGSVFAVDPWSKYRVKELKKFPKISSHIENGYPLQDDSNKILNDLYKDEFQGQEYHDRIFVDYNTIWYIDNLMAKTVFDIRKLDNKVAKSWYTNKLQKTFSSLSNVKYEDLVEAPELFKVALREPSDEKQ